MYIYMYVWARCIDIRFEMHWHQFIPNVGMHWQWTYPCFKYDIQLNKTYSGFRIDMLMTCKMFISDYMAQIYTCSTFLKWFENNLTFQHSFNFYVNLVQLIFRKTLLDSVGVLISRAHWRTDVHLYIKFETEILQNMHNVSVGETHFAHLLVCNLSRLSIIWIMQQALIRWDVKHLSYVATTYKIQSKAHYLPVVIFVHWFENITGNTEKGMD